MLNISTAAQHFEKTDPTMAALLQKSVTAERPLELPKVRPEHEYFGNIVRSIVSQQISTAAAAAVNGRVAALLGDITPQSVLDTNFDLLKSCGLSQKKTEYIKHNAGIWHEIPTRDFAQLSNTEVIAELTKLYGIGRWTAEMFLIFSLARSDVFSYGDLGLMNSLYKNYNYRPHYVRKIETTVNNWSPHRTVASLTLWYQLDNGPVIL